MATRSRKSARAGADAPGATLRDSAQKIWLAGLGAYERARSDGPRMFETLVEQGKALRDRAAEAADQALRAVREQAGEAQGKWDRLEQVFEDRVSRSLNRLGVLTAREVGDLSRQVEELNRQVREMMRSSAGGGAGSRRKTRTKSKARKARAKKARAKAAPAKAA